MQHKLQQHNAKQTPQVKKTTTIKTLIAQSTCTCKVQNHSLAAQTTHTQNTKQKANIKTISTSAKPTYTLQDLNAKTKNVLSDAEWEPRIQDQHAQPK
jgi:hypothetical protein